MAAGEHRLCDKDRLIMEKKKPWQSTIFCIQMFKCCCFLWSMRLAIPSWFRGMPLKLKKNKTKTNTNKKTNISTEHDRLKSPKWRREDQPGLAIYKHNREVELGATEIQLQLSGQTGTWTRHVIAFNQTRLHAWCIRNSCQTVFSCTPRAREIICEKKILFARE